MSKESLLKQVRSEDVVVWVGAGFSKYAGYPLGGTLRDNISLLLSPQERGLVDIHLQLPDYSEEFVRLKNGSRNELIRLIRDTYRKEPSSIDDHRLLASIPHFKTIITTNYDTLLERAYQDRGNLIFRESDIGLLDKRKVDIIKIHGDLSDAESIVVTKSDYMRFYKQDWSSPFWSHLATLMATNVLLFIGYSLEDANVMAMLEHISKYLKQLRKEAFFVAPKVAQHRVTHLQRLGIEVIEATGGEILAEIEADIRKNIFGDQRDKRVTTDTFLNYITGKSLLPELVSSPSGLHVASVKTIDGKPVKGVIRMEYENNAVYAKMKKSFLNGKIDNMTFSRDMLKQFNFDIEGLTMLGHDDIEEVKIFRPPVVYKVDITFPGKDLDIDGIPVTVVKAADIKIEARIHHLDLKLNFLKKKMQKYTANFSITRNSVHETVNSAISAYRFVKYFFSQEPFILHLHEGGSVNNNRSDHARPELVQEANQYILYFELLKKVEGFFGVKFRNISNINHENYETLSKLARIADGKSFEMTKDPVIITMNKIDDTTLNLYKKLETTITPLEIDFVIDEDVELHGQKIKLTSQRIHVPSARVINMDAIAAGRTKEIEVESRTKIIYTFYQSPVRNDAVKQS